MKKLILILIISIFCAGIEADCAEANSPQKAPAVKQEADFGPYMKNLQTQIKKNWHPPKGSESKKVVVLFSVDRQGNVPELKVIKSSGNENVDLEAIKAVTAASPFDKLPKEFDGQKVDINFTFDYNVFDSGNSKGGTGSNTAANPGNGHSPQDSYNSSNNHKPNRLLAAKACIKVIILLIFFFGWLVHKLKPQKDDSFYINETKDSLYPNEKGVTTMDNKGSGKRNYDSLDYKTGEIGYALDFDEYDENNRLIKKTIKNEDGQVEETREYFYDTDGKCREIKYYNYDGKPYEKRVLKWKDNLCAASVYYIEEDGQEMLADNITIESLYNDNNQLIKEKTQCQSALNKDLLNFVKEKFYENNRLVKYVFCEYGTKDKFSDYLKFKAEYTYYDNAQVKKAINEEYYKNGTLKSTEIVEYDESGNVTSSFKQKAPIEHIKKILRFGALAGVVLAIIYFVL